MTELTGTGDPAKSMALLWRTSEPTPRGRGAAAGLSVARVVETAIRIADGEGLGALSMRRLATELGVGPMSVYTYVPGRPELLDLMVDDVLGELPDLYRPASDAWRDRLHAVADANWQLYERHPWLLGVSAMARPPLGPGVMAKYELELRAVDGLGLDEVAMDAVVTLLNGFVTGTARGIVDRAQAEALTGITEAQWWAATEPYVARVFDGAAYPTVARVGPVVGEAQQAAYDPRAAFVFGLERLLDGVAALIDP